MAECLKTPVLLLFLTGRNYKTCIEARAGEPQIMWPLTARAPVMTDSKCIEARKIIDAVDWPCEIKRCFIPKPQLGKGLHCDWFFNMAEGIF
jgi:hypothetical protein